MNWRWLKHGIAELRLLLCMRCSSVDQQQGRVQALGEMPGCR